MILFLLGSIVPLYGQDTIKFDLDTLAKQDSFMQIIHCTVDAALCGEGFYQIPIQLTASDTTKAYLIESIKGNGDTFVKTDNLSAVVLIPKNKPAKTVWTLYENLFSPDCSKNRQKSILRLKYNMHSPTEGIKAYHKSICLYYHYD